jgi:hypothetical protein
MTARIAAYATSHPKTAWNPTTGPISNKGRPLQAARLASMTLPRFIDIDGRRYLWRDLVALRRAQATPPAQQPTLFALVEDCRPPMERRAAERYREPSLFTVLEREN